MGSGFEVYVEGLNVPRWSKKAWVEDGEKSLIDGELAREAEDAENGRLKDIALRVFAAVFARMALRCGAFVVKSAFGPL
jgi:hypothetical protein